MNLWNFVSVSMAVQEIQEKAALSFLPPYFDSLFPAEFVGIKKLAMFGAVLVHELGHFDVETTILSDFHHALFAPPFDRVDPVAGLSHAEGRMSDVIQPKLIAGRLFDLQQQVQASKLVR